MKKALNTKEPYQFKVHQSYTVEEILTAGQSEIAFHRLKIGEENYFF